MLLDDFEAGRVTVVQVPTLSPKLVVVAAVPVLDEWVVDRLLLLLLRLAAAVGNVALVTVTSVVPGTGMPVSVG